MIDSNKKYDMIPFDKPFIRCDYEVSDRDYVKLYKIVDLIEICDSYPNEKHYETIKRQREERKELGFYLRIEHLGDINICFIKDYFLHDIKQHTYHNKEELDKINIGEEVYIIREYHNSSNYDYGSYGIYDAVCLRKIDNYVEWFISSHAQAHKTILKNYYRIKKLEKIIED